ncbi:hypothetical protein RD792_011926 [Penstemon davidsonii]|uniref:NB-ARC domain-containing protein n=1 Tax=Penstemon davidsonii TaxID=160366 RepID=A0ABR0CX27_9LAMI|nr:hypothetical protein RD792_011926 [Penstemon davidsonii]
MGMGGSGKTTLARTLYNDSLTKHFDTCAWITVSREYNIRVTLLTLLECLRKLTDKMHHESDDKLGEYVHKTLKGRRYLIVIDDMWDTWAWDLMRRFFPDDRNGSRIMLTTRELNVATYAASSLSNTHKMNPLDDDSSWELLVEKGFREVVCPNDMEGIGREIAKKLGGLQLAISVMGGLLSAFARTVEFWDLVEKNGFVKPLANNSSLEDAAKLYLKSLVDRNLLLVRRQESNGKVKTFSIHDLLRKLCQKESCEDKLLWSKKFDGENITEGVETMRRVSAHPSSLLCGSVLSSD